MTAPVRTRPFRAVILDRDGVLTHFDLPMLREAFSALLPLSLEALALRWQRWCETGEPRTPDEEASFWAGFWDNVSNELGLPPHVRERLHAFDYTTAVRAFPEARDCLRTARSRGLGIGVLSNFPLVSLESSLAAAGLADAIDVARSAPMIGAAKPHPDAYLRVTEALGVPPEDCLFFDDEQEHVDGASALGIRAYRVDRTRTENALAEGIVCDLKALPELLDAP